MDQENKVIQADGLVEILNEFLGSFKLVFENDWEHAKFRLGIDDANEELNSFGCVDSFINPDVDDESNNWGNRGGLLHRYRALIAKMEELGIRNDPFSD